MSLEKANVTMSCKNIKDKVNNGSINFDHIIQRGYVWEKARKSAFIESLILGYPVPSIYAKRIDGEKAKDTVYYIMDGKQRLSTIKEFLNGEFKLTELAPVTYFSEESNEEVTEDISNLLFEELPAELQNHLCTVNISVIYFLALEKEEERELFKRLNAGKPLSTKSRLLASCKNIEGLLDIGSHDLFNEMLTNKGKENKNQVALVMKCHTMLNNDTEAISFESKVFNPMIEKANISEEEREELDNVFSAIWETHSFLMDRKEKKVARKLYTETHLVSLIPFFKKAIDDEVSTEVMAEWLVSFFDTKDKSASKSEEYNEACAGGVAKNVNIVARHNALAESYANFFEVDEDGSISKIDPAENEEEQTIDFDMDEQEHEFENDDIRSVLMEDIDTDLEEVAMEELERS